MCGRSELMHGGGGADSNFFPSTHTHTHTVDVIECATCLGIVGGDVRWMSRDASYILQSSGGGRRDCGATVAAGRAYVFGFCIKVRDYSVGTKDPCGSTFEPS